MRLLLDTHFALWWQTGDPRVTEQVRQLVDAADEVLVSRVSLWELAVQAGLGRLRIDLPVFAMQVEAMGFAWLPINNAHILKLADLPSFDDHRDPFDRLLVAQSMAAPARYKISHGGTTPRPSPRRRAGATMSPRWRWRIQTSSVRAASPGKKPTPAYRVAFLHLGLEVHQHDVITARPELDLLAGHRRGGRHEAGVGVGLEPHEGAGGALRRRRPRQRLAQHVRRRR